MQNTNQLYENTIPNQTQHYILMAATSDFETASQNWQLLKSYLNLDNLDRSQIKGTLLAQIYDRLDGASNRLLPMVYKNLQALDDPLLQSIKSFYRYTWARNHHFLEQFKKLISICKSLHIKPTMLKGLSTAFYYSDDPAIRVMEDIDVLVNPRYVDTLLDHLDKTYELLIPYKRNKKLNLIHAATYKFDKINIDIHWGILHKAPQWNLHKKSDAIQVINQEPHLSVLSPNYAFFHSITHGLLSNTFPTIRWISDCYLIQKKHTIDWHVIIQLGIESNYIEQIRMATQILPAYSINIPATAIKLLNSIPINTAYHRYIAKLHYYQQLNKHHIRRHLITKLKDRIELDYLYHKTYNGNILYIAFSFFTSAINYLKNRSNL